MTPIDKSVNRSLGPQIQNEVKRKGLKEGDKVCRIDFYQLKPSRPLTSA
jgi:hypothetical protein